MQTNAQLEFVQISNEVDWANVWSELGPMLDEHRQAWEMLYTKAYFAETVRNGDMQLWRVYSTETGKTLSFVLTQFTKYPRQTVGEVILALGKDLTDNLHVIFVLEQFWKRCGVSIIRFNGRLAWKKLARHYGYSLRDSNYYRNLEDVTLIPMETHNGR